MRDLEQRISAMVEKYIPDAPDADKVQKIGRAHV